MPELVYVLHGLKRCKTFLYEKKSLISCVFQTLGNKTLLTSKRFASFCEHIPFLVYYRYNLGLQSIWIWSKKVSGCFIISWFQLRYLHSSTAAQNFDPCSGLLISHAVTQSCTNWCWRLLWKNVLRIQHKLWKVSLGHAFQIIRIIISIPK